MVRRVHTRRLTVQRCHALFVHDRRARIMTLRVTSNITRMASTRLAMSPHKRRLVSITRMRTLRLVSAVLHLIMTLHQRAITRLRRDIHHTERDARRRRRAIQLTACRLHRILRAQNAACQHTAGLRRSRGTASLLISTS